MAAAATRRLTPLRNGFQGWQPHIVVSESMWPYKNLALEDWLLKHAEPARPTLLLYRNEPCAVIGRNQNPWKEVNLHNDMGALIVRRRSGGGTVYHDHGNSCYSIHLPRAAFDRKRTGRVVERAVRNIMGVPNARMNARNDLVVVDAAGQELKVSGSAYKIAGTRAYHHGTMLLESLLYNVSDVLANDKTGMDSKGVASVRAPVTTLSQWTSNRTATHNQFVAAMVQSFNEEFGISAEPTYVDPEDQPEIQKLMLELESWEWIYGQTPEFTHDLTHDFAWGKVAVHIHSKHGLIQDATFEGIDMPSLEGQRYASLQLDSISLEPREREVLLWLQREM